MKEKPNVGSPFFGLFCLTTSSRWWKMSIYISLFTVPIPVNYTSKFQELFAPTTYICRYYWYLSECFRLLCFTHQQPEFHCTWISLKMAHASQNVWDSIYFKLIQFKHLSTVSVFCWSCMNNIIFNAWNMSNIRCAVCYKHSTRKETVSWCCDCEAVIKTFCTTLN